MSARIRALRQLCWGGILGFVLTATGGVIEPNLDMHLAQHDPAAVVSTLVCLNDAVPIDALDRALESAHMPLAQRHETVVRALQENARTTQEPLLAELSRLQATGEVRAFEAYWIANVIRVDATPAVIRQIAVRADVATVYLNYPVEPLRPAHAAPAVRLRGVDSPEQNLIAINAPQVWALGIDGTGVLVSALDTGVDGAHPALASRWRGLDPRYAGHPQWAWFDPETHTTFPHDFGPHGTHTMGTLCGGAPGDQIGVAPGAQWIHAAVINRVDLQHTLSDVLLAWQWLIDPDGDPNSNWDVPAVSSNSWGFGLGTGMPACWEGLWPAIDACEAAGIVMIFSAGGAGPAPNTIVRPADRATDDYRNLAVGAVDSHTDGWPVASFSSRGPSYCTPNGAPAIKPNMSAPGIDIRSAYPGGGYSVMSGTSMAVPHIAGVCALMRQACPNMSVLQMKQILYQTAYDLGPSGEDNAYGWGMVDAYAAVVAAQQACLLHPGDLNCDGVVNFADINPFVLALTGRGLYDGAFPSCNWLNADCNADGFVNFADINPFVALLSGP